MSWFGWERGKKDKKDKKEDLRQLINLTATSIPTLTRVFQRRHPMVRSRLQNYFPQQ